MSFPNPAISLLTLVVLALHHHSFGFSQSSLVVVDVDDCHGLEVLHASGCRRVRARDRFRDRIPVAVSTGDRERPGAFVPDGGNKDVAGDIQCGNAARRDQDTAIRSCHDEPAL